MILNFICGRQKYPNQDQLFSSQMTPWARRAHRWPKTYLESISRPWVGGKVPPSPRMAVKRWFLSVSGKT